MPSLAVSPAGGRGGNCAARRMARARRRGFHVRVARMQLLHAIDLPVHAFQRCGEHLLALQRMLGGARKALASRRSLAACFAALRARQCSLLLAHVAQALAQRLEVFEPSLIDFGVMTTQDNLMLVVAEN